MVCKRCEVDFCKNCTYLSPIPGDFCEVCLPGYAKVDDLLTCLPQASFVDETGFYQKQFTNNSSSIGDYDGILKCKVNFCKYNLIFE